jgi:hypothetical protein
MTALFACPAAHLAQSAPPGHPVLAAENFSLRSTDFKHRVAIALASA